MSKCIIEDLVDKTAGCWQWRRLVYRYSCFRVTLNLFICADDHWWPQARVCQLRQAPLSLMLPVTQRALTFCQVSGSSSKQSFFHCRKSSSLSAWLQLSWDCVCSGPAASSGASVWVCASADPLGFLLFTSVLWRSSLTILQRPPISAQNICSTSSSSFQQPVLHHWWPPAALSLSRLDMALPASTKKHDELEEKKVRKGELEWNYPFI